MALPACFNSLWDSVLSTGDGALAGARTSILASGPSGSRSFGSITIWPFLTYPVSVMAANFSGIFVEWRGIASAAPRLPAIRLTHPIRQRAHDGIHTVHCHVRSIYRLYDVQARRELVWPLMLQVMLEPHRPPRPSRWQGRRGARPARSMTEMHAGSGLRLAVGNETAPNFQHVTIPRVT